VAFLVGLAKIFLLWNIFFYLKFFILSFYPFFNRGELVKLIAAQQEWRNTNISANAHTPQMPNTPLDVELLVGSCILITVFGAALFALIHCCGRLIRPNTRKTLTTYPTIPRYVLASETTALNARRYLLDTDIEFHVSATCSQCNSKPSTTIFANCGHSMACPSCAHNIWKTERICPVCKCPISSILHIVAHNVNTARVEELVGM
jgi:hypothetical protein